ncbi:DUF5819 family protein [Streptomyces sp. NBC_00091]|uniref:DUF5819 family protein n=1 Tax=Streptomyces sp. NBC_00091 TaxID=2975648 RepID=UPI00225584B7|nr:DUF5819 family protein [Streptomyces sp. NBC_00091]MCX5375215.1 DUF5819 family protein [Streptomyces sp. NBC_00091]
MTGTQEHPPQAWSPPALAALVAGAVVLAGAALWHGATLFLSLAPPNGISREYAAAIEGHVRPEFGQDWKLFAPNPVQENVAISARVRTGTADGAGGVGRWTDLTAQDIEAFRGTAIPSHLHQNMLRRAWDFYTVTHADEGGAAPDARAGLSERYLKRVVLQRLAPAASGERPVVAVQLRTRATAVEPPDWDLSPLDTTPRELTLPWWPVAGEDRQNL